MEDPYNRIFHQISGQRQYIESSTEWKEYLEALYHHGLLNDEELNKLLGNVTIAQGGVLPNIHSVLLPKIEKDGKQSQE